MLTPSEIGQIIAAIKTAYPNYKCEDVDVAIDMYSALFKDYTYEQVKNAVIAFIKTDTSGFPPSLGQIIDKIVVVNNDLNELSAWALVSKALKNGYYGAEEEYNKLPEPIQKALGSPAQLRVWAIDEHFNESVVSSNFMRAYKATLERMKNDVILGGLNNGIESNDRRQISNGIS